MGHGSAQIYADTTGCSKSPQRWDSSALHWN